MWIGGHIGSSRSRDVERWRIEDTKTSSPRDVMMSRPRLDVSRSPATVLKTTINDLARARLPKIEIRSISSSSLACHKAQHPNPKPELSRLECV